MFKDKTWLDWIKIIVAVDIAAVGIGLILGFDMHALAHIFGFVSRIPFGIAYLFVAYILFYYVFSDRTQSKDTATFDEDIHNAIHVVRKQGEKAYEKTRLFADTAHDKIDDAFNEGEDFLREQKDNIIEVFRKKPKDD